MTESQDHKNLKEIGKNMLINMGFGLSEIHEEYRVNVNGKTRNSKSFIVDVCGIRKTHMIILLDLLQ